MKVLCVAEKPSIAKAVTQILSGGQYNTRNSPNKYIKNYDFTYPQTNSYFTVTSVTGHLCDIDFDQAFSSWSSCDPLQLFEAPIRTQVKKESQTIATNLKTEARKVQMVMIWTDCDREGEHIGSEIVRVCKEANPRLSVRRARFSAIIAQQIHNAAQNPVQLDIAQANAVEARMMLDLRIGAAFTRFQTRGLQDRFAQLKEVISYGPCQFPTLGFVVSRYNQVKNFRPETFWYIYMSVSRGQENGASSSTTPEDDREISFTWRRGHLFDVDVAIMLFESVLDNAEARVTKVTQKSTKKWKPLPLTTVELQKAGSRLLKISPKTVLDIAEKLYQQGFLSYPRTETDQYDPQFNFATLIDKQQADPAWGGFATQLKNGEFNPPRRGKKDDKAHPPIHPTAYAGNLAGNEKKVYEYITRRFLASCSKDALGWETTVDVECGGEEFYASGLIITERNYLDVFPYDKWAAKELPRFTEGEIFQPSECLLREGKTTRPHLLTEADLVTLMDKNGIGTDATIAQHIQTIVDRKYVIEIMKGTTKYLAPSTLGVGLVEGYNEIGLERSLSKPQLRRETERQMVQICEGTRTKGDMLTENVEKYKDMFIRTRQQFARIAESVGNRVRNNEITFDIDFIDDDTEEGGDEGGFGGPGGGGGGGGGGGRGGRGGRGSRGGRGGGTGRGTRGTSSAPTSRRGRGGGSAGSGRGAPPRQDDNDDDMDVDGPPPPPPAAARKPPSNRSKPPASNNVAGPSHASAAATVPPPACDCRIPAATRTTTKEGPNKGRQFYRCGKETDKGCNFFKWVDEHDPSSANTPRQAQTGPSTPMYKPPPTIPAKRTASASTGAATAAVEPRCRCGNFAVVLEAGNGKKFWRCSNLSDRSRCEFFEWANEEDVTGIATGTRNTDAARRSGAKSFTGGGGGGATDGSCFKCGESGHWANACPNNGSAPPKSNSFVGSASNAQSGNACFKCGQPGHYSNVCPNGASGSTSKAAGTSGGNKCFKCGELGHYANACPGGGSGGGLSKLKRTTSSRGKRGRTRGGASTRGKATRKKKQDDFDMSDIEW